MSEDNTVTISTLNDVVDSLRRDQQAKHDSLIFDQQAQREELYSLSQAVRELVSSVGELSQRISDKETPSANLPRTPQAQPSNTFDDKVLESLTKVFQSRSFGSVNASPYGGHSAKEYTIDSSKLKPLHIGLEWPTDVRETDIIEALNVFRDQLKPQGPKVLRAVIDAFQTSLQGSIAQEFRLKRESYIEDLGDSSLRHTHYKQYEDEIMTENNFAFFQNWFIKNMDLGDYFIDVFWNFQTVLCLAHPREAVRLAIKPYVVILDPLDLYTKLENLRKNARGGEETYSITHNDMYRTYMLVLKTYNPRFSETYMRCKEKILAMYDQSSNTRKRESLQKIAVLCKEVYADLSGLDTRTPSQFTPSVHNIKFTPTSPPTQVYNVNGFDDVDDEENYVGSDYSECEVTDDEELATQVSMVRRFVKKRSGKFPLKTNKEGTRQRRTPASTDKCFNCGKLGHWAGDCRSKNVRKTTKPGRSRNFGDKLFRRKGGPRHTFLRGKDKTDLHVVSSELDMDGFDSDDNLYYTNVNNIKMTPSGPQIHGTVELFRLA